MCSRYTRHLRSVLPIIYEREVICATASWRELRWTCLVLQTRRGCCTESRSSACIGFRLRPVQRAADRSRAHARRAWTTGQQRLPLQLYVLDSELAIGRPKRRVKSLSKHCVLVSRRSDSMRQYACEKNVVARVEVCVIGRVGEAWYGDQEATNDRLDGTPLSCSFQVSHA